MEIELKQNRFLMNWNWIALQLFGQHSVVVFLDYNNVFLLVSRANTQTSTLHIYFQEGITLAAKKTQKQLHTHASKSLLTLNCFWRLLQCTNTIGLTAEQCVGHQILFSKRHSRCIQTAGIWWEIRCFSPLRDYI